MYHETQRNGMYPRQAPASKPRATFQNPLKPEGADPWLTYYDGWYYLSTTVGTGLTMRRARRLEELKTAKEKVVWQDDTLGRSKHLWAPEFHLLESGPGLRWFAYYTASDDVGSLLDFRRRK